MGRRIRIMAIRKEGPDIRLYVLALLALARQLDAEERQDTPDRPSKDSEEGAK
jgi:hypothetical protein